MPELPEVETVARQLAPALMGRQILGVRLLDDKLQSLDPAPLVGSTVEDVHRSGKQVVARVAAPDGSSLWLCVHLRMTGRLAVEPVEPDTDERHLRVIIALDRGWLTFRDARRFGTLAVHRRRRDTLPAGLEPLSRQHTARRLEQLIHGSRTAIKPWLLRQDRLVGLGNIYASEILFRAGIDPRRASGSLDGDEIRALHRHTRRVLRQAIDCCGTTFSDFQDSHGMPGGFQAFLRVYGKEGEACPGCGGEIRRLVQQQRSTFLCENCQR